MTLPIAHTAVRVEDCTDYTVGGQVLFISAWSAIDESLYIFAG
jgi:hypothetical protein